MFKLSRGGNNVPAEVQRWQYFLRRIGINQVGAIDADFGLKTETATKMFQVTQGLTANGKVAETTLEKAKVLGYSILPDNYYSIRAGTSFPSGPDDLDTPSNDSRNADFTCFKFLQKPLAQRPDKEAIVQKGNCADTEADWVAAHIVEISVPQLRFASGFSGMVRCHAKAAPIFRTLFEQWEEDDLLHLILSYSGCFVPRYKRDQAPAGTAGHGIKKSKDVSALSNHSFGSAFDINVSDNPFGGTPALCGRRGSTRELVASANKLNVYWGGHFSNKDGMHFEIAKV